MTDRNLFRPECAGASLTGHKKCPRCGARRQDYCGDDAAFNAQLERRNGNSAASPELISIDGGDIVIRITLDALVFASEHGCLCTFSKLKNDFRTVKVHDPVQWRDAIVRALRREKENGDTPVHLMLDEALEYALDQGEEGISVEGILP